jgi:hypothetical protein
MAIDIFSLKDNVLQETEKSGITKAVKLILKRLEIDQDNIAIEFRPPNADPKTLVITTEGDFEQNAKQIIRVPENLFTFPFEMVVALLTHEVHHVRQKSGDEIVMDKNEREFQAYYEGIFQKIFTTAPTAPKWLKKQFATHCLRYFNNMGIGSELQKKYLPQKLQVDDFIVVNS